MKKIQLVKVSHDGIIYYDIESNGKQPQKKKKKRNFNNIKCSECPLRLNQPKKQIYKSCKVSTQETHRLI